MSPKKKILILGAGISGLSAAWYIQKTRPEYDYLILEKTKTAGGYMQTTEGEHLIEFGPRIFKASKSKDLLALVEEVGFTSDLIFSVKEAKKRYLWINGKLISIFSLLPAIVKALLFEWTKPVCEEEESILEFGTRRLGKGITQKLLDPMMLGIYGGEIEKLSVDACLPILKKWEKKYGSVTAGLFSYFLKKKEKKDPRLLSFQKGVGSFIHHLEQKLDTPIVYGAEALSIEQTEGRYTVHTQKGAFMADKVIVALPAYEAAQLLRPIDIQVADVLGTIPYVSLQVVHVVIEGQVLQYPGFGYLVPSLEGEPLLGVIFDSMIFPQQKGSYDTKLTFMLRSEEFLKEEMEHNIHYYLRTHLKIEKPAKKIEITQMPSAIPQYVMGHHSRIDFLQRNSPQGIHLIGNYLKGSSVSDAIKMAKNSVSLL